MKRVIFTVIVLSLFAVAGSEGQVRLDELESKEGIEYLKANGEVYSGPVSEPGRLSGTVQDGKRTGTWTWLYESGGKEYQTTYSDGLQEISLGWYEDGTPQISVEFQNGRVHGTRKNWSSDGKPLRESIYKEGVPNGSHKLWDHKGNLLYTATFVDGHLDGTATWWYPNGAARWIIEHSDRKRSGEWTQLGPDGELMVKSFFEDGQLVDRNDPHKNH